MAERTLARGGELRAVESFLERSLERPAALRLEGEAGFGKTRLWRHAIAAADERGFLVLSCSCAESEGSLSFAALGDLLAPVVEDALGSLLQPQRRALEAALLLAEAEGPPPDQRAVSLAVLAVLRGLAAAQPVLVAVDDVQWLDPPSARVLQFALRRLADERVGVAATLRTGEGHADPLELERVFEQLARLEVGPLPPEALGELVRTRLDRRLPRSAIAGLHRASSGNPFYALELARTLDLEDAGATEPLPVPESMSGLVLARIRRLPAPVQESLLVAAALAHPTWSAIEEAGGRHLAEAFDAGVVELERERVRFTHPLLASAVYTQAPPDERRRLHRRLAEVVADPEERARHLALAATGPDESVAQALEQAGAHARARGAPDAAAELYDRARRLTPPESEHAEARRAVAAVECLHLVGDFDRARQIGDEVAARLPPGPERARLLWYRGPTRARSGDERFAQLEQTLAEAGEDWATRAAIREEMAWRLAVYGDLRGALEQARATLADTERAGDDARRLSALSTVAWIEAMLGGGVRADLADAVAAPSYSADAYRIYESPHMRLGVLRMWADDLGAARVALESEHRRALDWGEHVMRAAVLTHLTELEWRAGNWGRAVDYAEEAVGLTAGTQFTQLQGCVLGGLALAAGAVGRADEARDAAERAIEIAETFGDRFWVPHYRAARGLVELSLGDAAAAAATLGPAVRLLEQVGVGEPGIYAVLPLQMEALSELGELDEAEALATTLEQQGRRLGRVSALAAAARGRGLLATARGDRPAAESAFGDALDLHDRLPYPFELARTLVASGTSLRRFQQQRAARERLERGVALLDELGARLWAERARAELASVAGRRTTPGKLTPTEQRVAELVAAGKSNREVADALFMSPKTVEWNLSKVYRKLRVHSRTELAAKLAKG